MSDILSTRLVRDNLGHRPQGGTATSPVATVAVADASFKLPNLTIGTLITGVVAEQTARNTVIIKTDKGNLTILSKVPLEVGNTVVLQLQSVGAQSRVVILSINGQPTSGSEKQAPGTDQGRPTKAVSVASPQTQSNPSSILNPSARDAVAMPVGPKPGSRPPANTSENSLKMGPFYGVTDNQGISKSPLTNGLVLSAQVVEAEVPPSSAVSNSVRLHTGDVMTVRVLGIAMAGSAPLEPQVPPQTGSQNWMQAVVTSNNAFDPKHSDTSPSGPGPKPLTGLVLAAAEGRLVVSAAPPGPEGTRVLLEIIGHSAERAERFAAISDTHQAFMRLAGEWTSLKEITEFLNMARAQNAGPATQPPIPTPGTNLASTILFFLSALKGGDYRGWLGGDNVNKLESDQHGRILTRLGDDFVQLGRLATEPQPSGWQVMLVPIALKGGLEQIRMFYRRMPGKQDHNDDLVSRFIVEAELSHFGPVQLDGLIRPSQIDLVLRSDIEIATNMQGDIREIFQSALEICGHKGSVRFEARSDALINLFLDEGAKATHGSNVIV